MFCFPISLSSPSSFLLVHRENSRLVVRYLRIGFKFTCSMICSKEVPSHFAHTFADESEELATAKALRVETRTIRKAMVKLKDIREREKSREECLFRNRKIYDSFDIKSLLGMVRMSCEVLVDYPSTGWIWVWVWHGSDEECAGCECDDLRNPLLHLSVCFKSHNVLGVGFCEDVVE